MNTINIIDKLNLYSKASREELVYLLKNLDEQAFEYLQKKAQAKSVEIFGNKV